MFLFSATNLIKTIFPQTAASDAETVTETRLLKAKQNKITIKTKPTKQTGATECWLSGPPWRRRWQAAQWILLFAFAPSGGFPGCYTQEELSRFPESRRWRWMSGDDQETRIQFARCSSAEQRAALREPRGPLSIHPRSLGRTCVRSLKQKDDGGTQLCHQQCPCPPSTLVIHQVFTISEYVKYLLNMKDAFYLP